jgi:hypothetical protein
MKKDDLVKRLRNRRPSQGAFADHFQQPQNNMGAGNGANVPPAAPANPDLHHLAFEHIHDGPEKEYYSTVLSDFNPETARAVEFAIEHLSIGNTEVKDVLQRKTKFAEGLFAPLSKADGLCERCNLPALKIFHCERVDCRQALCKRHAIPLPKQHPKDPDRYVCKDCHDLMEFHRDTWAEHDAQHGAQ